MDKENLSVSEALVVIGNALINGVKNVWNGIKLDDDIDDTCSKCGCSDRRSEPSA